MTGDESTPELDRLRDALATVQTDLVATLPEWSELQILVIPDHDTTTACTCA